MNWKSAPKLPLVIIGLMFVAGLIAYPGMPARIPTHWGVSGQIDAWSDKSLLSMFSQPLMALGLYVLFLVMPYFDPKRRNLLKSKDIYALMLNLVTGLFAILFAATILSAHYNSFPTDRIVLVAVGLLLAVIGNYMGRIKQNWTMGARMSWTLSDEVVWTKTNRLTGRLFVAAGVCAMGGAFLPQPWGFVLVVVPILAILPVTYIYSMVLYRRRHPEDVSAD